MAQNDTYLSTAHLHAANADDHLSRGLIVLASDEHSKAADAYQLAYEHSHDDSTRRTLRMLHNEHKKASRELQRKIAKLEEEGKDPSLPQKPDIAQSSAPRQTSNVFSSPARVNTSSPQPLRPMSDSRDVGDESFMLLAGQRSDPGDAFNQFWNIMQGMLDNLSQPVAFATAPLGDPAATYPPADNSQENSLRRDGNLSSDTDADEPIFSKFTRRIGIGREGSKSGRNGYNGAGVQSQPKNGQPDDFDFDEDDFLEDGDDLSGSFCLIPGGESSVASLKKENAALKNELASMKSQLETTERVLKLRKEQDLQLRDSIFMATREAQRALGASAVHQRPGPPLDYSSLNTNVPAVPLPGINSGREAQYARRVKELEEELRLMKAENEKHKLMIGKFRERWEKLKDSAKRKKEAKAAAAGVRERIVEEPEAEEELDESNPHHY